MITFEEWLADRQRLFNVVANLFKLKKLDCTSDSTLCRFKIAKVEELDKAKRLIKSLGFEERDNKPLSDESLTFYKNEHGYIYVGYDYVVGKVEINLGLKQPFSTSQLADKFEKNNKDLLTKYNANSFIDLLSLVNHESNNEKKEKIGQRLLGDFKNSKFIVVPDKYRVTKERAHLLFQDGLFINCDYTDMFVWANHIFI